MKGLIIKFNGYLIIIWIVDEKIKLIMIIKYYLISSSKLRKLVKRINFKLIIIIK